MSSDGGAAGKERLRSASIAKSNGAAKVDLYGYVSMSYDSVRDVLMLSCYGKYYRVE